MSERVCSKCHVNAATSNGYCKSCDAERRRPAPTERPDTLSFAASLGIQVDPAAAMFADTLTDAQALFLLERVYGKEVAQRKIKLLMEEGRLE